MHHLYCTVFHIYCNTYAPCILQYTVYTRIYILCVYMYIIANSKSTYDDKNMTLGYTFNHIYATRQSLWLVFNFGSKTGPEI